LSGNRPVKNHRDDTACPDDGRDVLLSLRWGVAGISISSRGQKTLSATDAELKRAQRTRMRGEYIDLMELLVVSDALRVVALLEYLDSADLLSPIHISPRANRSL